MSNRAAVLPAKFAQLVVKDTAIPTPKDDEILIKIHSAAVNPVDYKIQKAGRFFEDFPRVLGEDAAGTVEAVGPSQTRFKKGDRVLSFIPIFASPKGSTEYGGFQQYSLTFEAGTGLIPDSVSFDEAATLPLALSTVADGYYHFLGLDEPSLTPKQKKEYLLVWGGASSVGQLAIQLAVASGYKVITTASKRNHEALLKLGAEKAFDYADADVVTQIKAYAEIKLIYDSIAVADSIRQGIEIMSSGGKIAYVQLTPETANVPCPENIKWTRVFAGSLVDSDKPLGSRIFKYAEEALSQGKLVPNAVTLRGGLDDLQETFDYYSANGAQFTKYVIHP